VGVAELAQEAARILAVGGPVQGRGTVSELPDERTVRYYLSEGLLSPAAEKQGTASVFGYAHLLQLLVIKKLQAKHLPIRAIRELVGGRSERQLERLLGGDPDGRARSGDKNEALRYLETLVRKPPPVPPPPAPRRAAASPNARDDETPPPLPAAALAAPAARDTWSRVEIEPGLEVHVSSSYRPPGGRKGVLRLVRLFVEAVKRLTGNPGKRGS
ncbi:MAG TPA: MerR family transcriptional regulator, partial [Pyrinomonadaceae bacterium]|nr:MerR family transcriptional regulator [Pyrinomonadaceae bacterium]